MINAVTAHRNTISVARIFFEEVDDLSFLVVVNTQAKTVNLNTPTVQLSQTS